MVAELLKKHGHQPRIRPLIGAFSDIYDAMIVAAKAFLKAHAN
jgi:hypothetical protein